MYDFEGVLLVVKLFLNARFITNMHKITKLTLYTFS